MKLKRSEMEQYLDINTTGQRFSNKQISSLSRCEEVSSNDLISRKPDAYEMEKHLNDTDRIISSHKVPLPSTSSPEASDSIDSTYMKPDPDDVKKVCLSESVIDGSSQQMSLPSTSSHEANSLNDSTFIKSNPDDLEYNVKNASQDVSDQQISLPSPPLKCEVREEIIYCRCQFCPYSDIDFDRLKFHTFTQHPTGAAVVHSGKSEYDIKFICVKETCDFSTTVCTVYEEHLMKCCPLHQALSGNEEERLKSTLQFVIDYHNKCCFWDVTGALEYFSSFNKAYSSEDEQLQRKHIENKDSLSVVSKSSSVSDIQASMVCEDVGGRKLEGPLSAVPISVPVFVDQNKNTDLIESQTDISETIFTSESLQDRNNEETGSSAMKISKTQVDTHLEMQTEKKTYACGNCEKSFRYHRDFLRHMRIHSGEKPFKCEVCNKAFSQSVHLNVHKRTHTGERPFKCNVCGKEVTTSSDLTVHKRTHTGERPFQCGVCDKVFSQSQHLIAHMRTHTGERPYQCNVCTKEFSRSSDLTVHRRTHTGEKPLKCNICDRGFADSSTLIIHKRRHTGEKPFKCNMCSKEFIRSSELNVHKRKHARETAI